MIKRFLLSAVAAGLVLGGCTGAKPESAAPPARNSTEDTPAESPNSTNARSGSEAAKPSPEPASSAMPGFTPAREGPSSAPVGGAPLTPEEQMRYDAVARAWLTALNAEDQDAYRGLHSDEGWAKSIDWWQNMFAGQRAKFGPIVRAYPCTREVIRFGRFGFQCGDLPNAVSFVAIFEERVGGVFSFTLDAEGKIAATSVFIKEEIATYDPGPTEPIYSR